MKKLLLLFSLLPACLGAFPDREVVAVGLVLEAGGESALEMQAVMNVIQNRAKGDPSKFKSVIMRKYQFSCFNSYNAGKVSMARLVEIAKSHPRWYLAVMLVGKAFEKDLPDITKGANHYCTNHPKWSKGVSPVLVLGRLRFYRL